MPKYTPIIHSYYYYGPHHYRPMNENEVKVFSVFLFLTVGLTVLYLIYAYWKFLKEKPEEGFWEYATVAQNVFVFLCVSMGMVISFFVLAISVCAIIASFI